MAGIKGGVTDVYQKILGQLYRRLGRQPEPCGLFRRPEERGDPPQRDFCQDWAGQAELGLPPDRGVSGVYTLRWRGDGLPLRH